MPHTMIPLDYAKSFLLGTSPGNEVRFWVESRTRLIDQQAGTTEDYIQCASCKSENTFAETELLMEDNYDFLPIFGPELCVIFRRKAWLNPEYRETRLAEEMWGGPISHLIEAGAARELKSDQDILDATYAFDPIVAQTEITNADTGLTAIIEYPVKTMNTIRASRTYQVDTGPIAFFDLTRRAERPIDQLSLAFVVFNAPHFADFVIEGPTTIGDGRPDGDTRVHHYANRVSLPATNRLYAM